MANVTTTAVESLSYAAPVRQRGSGGRLLVWTVGIVVIGGMLISVMLPSLCRSRETANRVKCYSNLRSIGQAITLYAQDNGGQYPPSLAVLAGQVDISPTAMICPSSNDEKSSATNTAGVVGELTAAETDAAGHKHCLSYVYVGRKLNAKTISAETILVYEPLTNHDGDGTSVLFGDGHVEFIDKRSWPKVAADAGLPVASSPTTRS